MSTESIKFVTKINTNSELNEFCDSVNSFIRKNIEEGNHILEIFPNIIEKEDDQFLGLEVVMTRLKDKDRYMHSLSYYKQPEIRILLKEGIRPCSIKIEKFYHRVILRFSCFEKILSKIFKKDFLKIYIFESSFVTDKSIKPKFINGLS